MPLPLSASISKITATVLDKKSIGLGALLGRWEAIVGKDIAAIAIPVKLSRPRDGDPAVLHIAVSPARALEIQHDAPLVLARINGFFGYKAIGALRLAQRQVRPSRRGKLRASESQLSELEIEASVSRIEDPELQLALARLGRSMRKNSDA